MVVYEATFIHFVFTHSYPESSKEKIFVFLQPLIDELIDFWLMIYILMMLRQKLLSSCKLHCFGPLMIFLLMECYLVGM